MAVSPSDVIIRLSGGSINTDPDASLGGVMSNTSPDPIALNNLFGNVSAGESAAGSIDYRCVYILNNHGTDTLNSVAIWFNGDSPAAGSAMGLALDPAGIDEDATTIANETTAPAGVTFLTPYAEIDAIAIGNLGPGQYIGVWLRRTIEAGADAYANDGVTLRIKGTPA